MSSPPLGPYVIGERLGTSVWLAEDTRSEKKVAIKLLTKALPKEAGKRDAMVRDLRVAAALYHPFLAPIHEITPIGDNLVMVMDVVEGQSITKRLQGQAVDRTEFFRLALQLASAVKFLHTKGLLHGNLNGDAVIVTAEGQVKLAGLNLTNLVRKDRTSLAFQQKGTDAKLVSYMAPEQITTQQIDEKSDVFSVGVLLYEIATGKLPFVGATAPDIARAIVEGQPVSPRTVNPQIDNAVIGTLGPCLFKDPNKRQKDLKSVVESIEKAAPEAVAYVEQLEKKSSVAAVAAKTRRSILFVADVANFDDTAARNPEAAARAAARMQQILGESVYLFDGKVIDPFGTRMIAELPSVESAVEAGRKGEFDFSPGQQGGEPLNVRMLLHAGGVEMRDGAASGPAIERAIETLSQLQPNTLFISEEFVKEGRPNVRLRDAGARAGVKLYTIAPGEGAPPAVTELSPTTAELAAEDAAEVAAVHAAVRAKGKKTLPILAAVAVVVVLVIAGIVAAWMRRGNDEPLTIATGPVSTGPKRPSAANPKSVFVAPFTVEGTDPILIERANTIRLGALQILRTFPELRVVDAADRDTASFSAVVHTAAAGPELVPSAGTKLGAPVALLDSASGIRAVVQWVTTEVSAEPRTYAVADALNSFADAVVARSLSDATKADASLRAAMTSDPAFLPAQLLAMEYFTSTGKEADALAAAKRVTELDPSNLDAARKLARASLSLGDLQQVFAAFDLVLKREPKDAEALNLIARYAVAAGDTEKFTATLRRLRSLPTMQVTAHEPDVLSAAGRIDAAIQRYYTVEETASDSAALQLKIGRLSVLRHSLEMANFKLEKLQKLDPLYGSHMLSAYIAAEKRQNDVAMQELDIALTKSVAGDDAWTSAAEIHAILNDTAGAMGALEKAAQRKEPTAAYVLSHPLFRYLQNDPRFEVLKGTLVAQQAEIRTALAQVQP